MLDRDQLETFATIVAEGTFERAAMVLNVSRGAISQRMKLLEERLAKVLLVRERPVVPTPAGEVLLRHVKALRVSEQAVMAALRPADTVAMLPIAVAVNADSLATWVPGVLWSLLNRFRIALEVVADDQAHTLSRLTRGEVIGCVSTESRSPSGFLSCQLGTMQYRCYATPEFVARHFPHGLSVRAVLHAPAVAFNRKDTLHDQFLRSVFGLTVERYAKHYMPSPGTLLQALRIGVGYGLAPVMQVSALGADTGLVEVAPHHPVDVDLYWHHWEQEAPLTHEVTKCMIEHAHAALEQRVRVDGSMA
jgi:LysR family transcriptional regulator (chromosome initiation inhibitor)